MTDRTEVFVDVLMSASLRDGVVRLEFGGFAAPPGADAAGERGDARPAAKHMLFIPVPGFMRAAGMIGEVAKRLEQQQAQHARRAGEGAPDGGGGGENAGGGP